MKLHSSEQRKWVLGPLPSLLPDTRELGLGLGPVPIWGGSCPLLAVTPDTDAARRWLGL